MRFNAIHFCGQLEDGGLQVLDMIFNANIRSSVMTSQMMHDDSRDRRVFKEVSAGIFLHNHMNVDGGPDPLDSHQL